MCGVFAQTGLDFRGLSDTIRHAKKALRDKKILSGQTFIPNFNIWTGMNALVITNQLPDFLQNMQFGYSPTWAKKQMYLFNARTEGDENTSNNANYQGDMGIFEKPSFKDAIIHNRCIVPMDYFVEGPENIGLKKPFLFKRFDNEPFVVAGIWSSVQINSITLLSFAILTTAAAKIVQQIGHHRSPLVLKNDSIDEWLDQKTQKSTLQNLMQPFDSEPFEYYQISDGISKKHNSKDVMTPILTLF